MRTHTKSKKAVVITYGTFDLFHVGHLNLLRRLRALGDHLVVGVSTDEFNERKGKRTVICCKDRMEIVAGVRYVDEVFAEESWGQKPSDIARFNASVFGMGNDWAGKFDDMSAYCKVVYLPRTADVSSTEVKRLASSLDRAHILELKSALDLISSIVGRFD